MSDTCDCCPVCGSAGVFSLDLKKGEHGGWWIATIEQDEAEVCCTVTQLGKFANRDDAVDVLTSTDIDTLLPENDEIPDDADWLEIDFTYES